MSLFSVHPFFSYISSSPNPFPSAAGLPKSCNFHALTFPRCFCTSWDLYVTHMRQQRRRSESRSDSNCMLQLLYFIIQYRDEREEEEPPSLSPPPDPTPPHTPHWPLPLVHHFSMVTLPPHHERAAPPGRLTCPKPTLSLFVLSSSLFLSKVEPHPPQPQTKQVFYINPIATPRFQNTTSKVRLFLPPASSNQPTIQPDRPPTRSSLSTRRAPLLPSFPPPTLLAHPTVPWRFSHHSQRVH